MNKRITMPHVFNVIWREAFRVAPVAIIFALGVGILHSIFQVLQTVTMQKFFHSVQSLLAEQVAAKGIATKLILLGTIIVLVHICGAAHNAMIEILSIKVVKGLSHAMHAKAANLSAEYFEGAERLDDMEKARQGIEKGTYFLNTCFIIVTYYIPYFVFMGIYLISIKPIFILSIGLVFLPVLFAQLYRRSKYTNLEDHSAVYRRRYMHYEECIRGSKYSKETRMLGAYEFFYDLYVKAIKIYASKKWDVVKATGTMELLMKGITLIGYMGILLLFVSGVLSGDISVGTFAALFTSVNTMFHIMEELICGHIGTISEQLAGIVNYVKFLELPEEEGEQEISYENGLGIDIEGLSYCYPNQDTPALEHISFHIEPGETIAVVGVNGAGKSTLMRLLCGQYLPKSGRILFNGKDTGSIQRKSLADGITAVFQEFQKYEMSLTDNIALSDGERESADRTIRTLLYDIGLETNGMPEGLETILSRQFGGIELSGGQWQKIAIARGSFKRGQLIILDEPTAAIDPLEENRMYQLFEEMSCDKTAVIVTHRLAASRIADRILVLENGRIIELGSHEQLLKQNGEYARMYQKQKELYSFEK